MSSSFLEMLREIETRWQKAWYESGIFCPRPDEKQEKFFITVPYPYVSGPPHIGHGRTFTIADIIARFYRMLGRNVLFPIAWHITGTPIQAIADMISRGDEETISRYVEYVRLYVHDEEEARRIVQEFRDGRKLAEFFTRAYENDFRKMGYSMDFTRQFTTGDPDYSAFIIWQYLKLRKKGLITRGKHVVLYAPDEGHAVGEHDIKGGDEIEVRIVEFTLVKFKLEDSDTYLVAATLRPETIFGVTNVWVHPDATYVEAEVNGEKWIISKKCAWKLQYQDKHVKILREFTGRELIGKIVTAPLVNRKVPVLPALFVDDDVGTGVVYSVPGHAPYDYAALIDLKGELGDKFGVRHIAEKIEPISIIRSDLGELPTVDVYKKLGITTQLDKAKLDEATRLVYQTEFYTGVMKENTPLAGMRVSEAREKAKSMLLEQGLGDKMFELEPPKVFTRAGNRVIAAVIHDQWFIDYRVPEWKETGLKFVKEILKVVPEKYRQQFISTIEWLELRPCARKRGIGTRLPWDPDWIIESLSDSTIYMAFYTIVKQLRQSGLSEKLTKLVEDVYRGNEDALSKIEKLFDYVFLGVGNVEEVAKLFEVEPSIIESIRREFLYWYPVDLRHSGIDLIPSHLTFFIMHHIAIFPPELWPRAISLNEYVIREGRKMSKSLGNVLEICRAVRMYSADVVRLYIAYAADLETTLDWRDSEVRMIVDQLERFWNIVNNIIALGKPSREYSYNELKLLSKYAIASIRRTVRKARQALENFRLREYVVEAFFNVMNVVEEYLNNFRTCDIDIDEARYVLHHILERWLKILQPVIPHICEELWHRLGNESFISLEKWPPEEEYDEELLKARELIERTLDDIKSIMRARERKVRKVYLYVGPDEVLYRLVKDIVKLLDEGKNMRDIIRELAKREEYRSIASKVPDIVRKVVSGQVPRIVLSRDKELELFRQFSRYMSLRLGVDVEVQDAQKPVYDPLKKASQALPGRPAIYIEEEAS